MANYVLRLCCLTLVPFSVGFGIVFAKCSVQFSLGELCALVEAGDCLMLTRFANSHLGRLHLGVDTLRGPFLIDDTRPQRVFPFGALHWNFYKSIFTMRLFLQYYKSQIDDNLWQKTKVFCGRIEGWNNG